jgi:hypothetical protein
MSSVVWCSMEISRKFSHTTSSSRNEAWSNSWMPLRNDDEQSCVVYNVYSDSCAL